MIRRRLRVLAEFVLPLIIVVVWWVRSADSTSPYFPPLRDIVAAFGDNWLFARVGSDVYPSLLRLGAGFTISVVLGVGLGLLLGLYPTCRRATEPIVEFLRAIPAPAMIPFGILILGVGDTMKTAIITIVCLWPVLLNTIDGVRGVDPLVLDTATVYGVPGRTRLRRIIIPAASPQIFAGLRTSISLALIVMVISEMVASSNGIGYFVLQSQRLFDISDMWSGVLLIGLLGYLLNMALLLVEHRVLRWHREARRASAD